MAMGMMAIASIAIGALLLASSAILFLRSLYCIRQLLDQLGPLKVPAMELLGSARPRGMAHRTGGEGCAIVGIERIF
jgi:hypothetical protein